MKIDTKDIKVIFEFSPRDYYLIYSDSSGIFKEKIWALCPRIDRSEKGKDDDVGSPVIFLSDEEAEECKKAGFSYMEL